MVSISGSLAVGVAALIKESRARIKPPDEHPAQLPERSLTNAAKAAFISAMVSAVAG